MSADEQERAGYRKYAALHKQWRDVIHHGVQWRLDMPDTTTLAHGVVSEDKGQALFLVSQLAMPDYSLMAPAHRGPGGGARYHITLLDHPNIQITGRAVTPCASCRRG